MAKKRSKDNTTVDLNELIKERNSLLVNRKNMERLKELNDKIDYIFYGIDHNKPKPNE